MQCLADTRLDLCRQGVVDAVDGLTVGLGRHVQRVAPGAQHATLGGRLELDGRKLLLGEAALQPRRDDLAIAQRLIATDDAPLARLAALDRHAHLLSARLDQRDTPRRAGL